jgi:hypothetical protein
VRPVVARARLCLTASKSAQINQDSGARNYKRRGSKVDRDTMLLRIVQMVAEAQRAPAPAVTRAMAVYDAAK